MAKTLTSEAPQLGRWRVSVDPETGDVDGITVGVTIPYGGLPHGANLQAREDVDLWAIMGAEERVAFQSVYDRLTAEIVSVYGNADEEIGG